MKRMMMLLLAMMLALCGVSAVAEERTGVDLTYARVVEMAQYMKKLATGDYLDIKQASDTTKSLARSWAEGINDTPRLVVQMDVENQAQVLTVRATFSQEAEIVQDEAMSQMEAIIISYLIHYAGEESGVTGASYSEISEVNSLLDPSMMYAEEGRAGDGMYIVLYENAAPILLLVYAENDAVSIRGMFLPSTKLQKCQNYGQVSLYMMLSGFGMNCQELLPE